MKVKNIVFSGFAAAILMGTVNANAATTAFQIASKAYVDSKVSTGLVDESTGNPISVATALAGKADADDVDALETAVDTLTGDASTSGSVAHAEASAASAATAAANAQDDVDALETAVGDTSGLETTFGSGNDTVVEALGALKTSVDSKADATATTNALADKVNVSDKATTIGTVATASDDKWATEKAVATVVQGITGGSGTVSQQIEAVVGNLGTNATTNEENTVEEALALKADASDVSTLSSTVSGHTTSIGALETAVGDSNSGLVADVATLQANTTGLTAAKITGYDTLVQTLNGYSTCVADNENESGHCVLSATSSGMEWVFVTDPWTE